MDKQHHEQNVMAKNKNLPPANEGEDPPTERSLTAVKETEGKGLVQFSLLIQVKYSGQERKNIYNWNYLKSLTCEYVHLFSIWYQEAIMVNQEETREYKCPVMPCIGRVPHMHRGINMYAFISHLWHIGVRGFFQLIQLLWVTIVVNVQKNWRLH